MYEKHVKRIFDFIFAIILLLILSPLFIIVAIAINIDSKGPVFFKQERSGQHGKVFNVYKFRTMINNAEKIGSGLYTDSTDPRITRVGEFLRKTSIDELPQLINIIKGEMSFIGPRPVPMGNLDEFNIDETERLKVKPGITGWAQVNGRNTLTWPEKNEKDIWYVNNISLLLDIKIIFMTIKVILFKEGVYSGRYASMVKDNNQKESKTI